MKLTVIITTHNRCQLLPNAIGSILKEGGKTPIIVVDDASTDGTETYCRSLTGIHYIRLPENKGTAAARNAGIQACQTDYIAFLDDDDWRLPDTLEKQVAILETDPSCALVYGKVYFANQQQELNGESNLHLPAPEGDVVQAMLNRNFITLSTVVARREALVQSGMFDTAGSMLGLEDWDMWLRMSLRYRIRALSLPVAVYRKPEKGSGQWYSDLGRQYTLAAKAYRKKWFRLPGLAEKIGEGYRAERKKIMAHNADVILYSARYNARTFGEKLSRIYAALRCRPQQLLELKFYKSTIKILLNRP